jgi:oligopeptidase B
VPVTLLYRKDTKLDGSAPCLLYGYGSYGIAIPASFNTNCLSLADRGFVYAIAHIRGGKDKGFAWYEDGKRGQEKHLQGFRRRGPLSRSEKFTSADRIVAQGGSAGGMLMGAVANMAPDAFGGDHRRGRLRRRAQHHARRHAAADPAGMAGMGQPDRLRRGLRDHRGLFALRQCDRKAYPPILAVAGLTDPRVTYWEPAKWVARLRQMSTSGNPVLFKINMAAGHAGASGRFQRLEEIAYEYAFALKVVGKV